MEKKYKYKISVIIPIYNVEEYLEETIQSVIHQTIGFENIQMILVNDGSPDNSEEICLKYKNKYPDNVVYIKQKNAGVSAARNNGFSHAEGEFVNFLDSDDKYSLNAYKVGYEMLTNNNLDMVSYRVFYFDALNKPLYLDFKFKDKTDKIVDLTKNPYYPVYHITSVLIRKELVKNIKFDINLVISEDVKYLSDALVKTKKIGLIASECFYYRKRQSETSAIQTSTKKPTFFWNTPKYCFEHILDLADKYEDMSDYLSFVVAYDLRFRIFNAKTYILNSEDKIKYMESIRHLLKRCDDRIICAQLNVLELKYLKELDYKYRTPIYKNIDVLDGNLTINGNAVCKFNDLTFNIYNLYIENGKLIVNSNLEFCLNNDFDLYYKVNDKYYKFEKNLVRDCENTLFRNDYDYKISCFDAEIDLNGINRIEFYLEINGKKHKIKPSYSNFSKLNNLKNSYFKKDGYVITHDKENIIVNNKKHFLLIRYLFDLFKKKELLPLGLICLYYLTYIFNRKDNWIISDREDEAGDNGEAFIEYIKNNNLKKNVYFGIDKNSKDINRISKIAKIVNFRTIKYYLLYLNSEAVISSHADNYILLPFGKKQIYLNFIVNRRFIFLQHGISIGNLGLQLDKFKKNFDLFITSTNDEYKNLLKYYFYDNDVIKLTGMPRYDKLSGNSIKKEKIILFYPTWRYDIAGPSLPRRQIRPYRNNYVKSEYYEFYNKLLSSEKLLNFLKKKGYKIIYCLHPAFKKQIKDYESSDIIEYVSSINYAEVLKKSSLLVTDYSSISYDFAYLRKPVLYTQFDKEKFYSDHIYFNDIYFDFDKNGFGEVAGSIDETIDYIIEIVNNNCKMSDKYIKRVEKCFKYNDTRNCERVYNEIVKILKAKK